MCTLYTQTHIYVQIILSQNDRCLYIFNNIFSCWWIFLFVKCKTETINYTGEWSKKIKPDTINIFHASINSFQLPTYIENANLIDNLILILYWREDRHKHTINFLCLAYDKFYKIKIKIFAKLNFLLKMYDSDKTHVMVVWNTILYFHIQKNVSYIEPSKLFNSCVKHFSTLINCFNNIPASLVLNWTSEICK